MAGGDGNRTIGSLLHAPLTSLRLLLELWLQLDHGQTLGAGEASSSERTRSRWVRGKPTGKPQRSRVGLGLESVPEFKAELERYAFLCNSPQADPDPYNGCTATKTSMDSLLNPLGPPPRRFLRGTAGRGRPVPHGHRDQRNGGHDRHAGMYRHGEEFEQG